MSFFIGEIGTLSAALDCINLENKMLTNLKIKDEFDIEAPKVFHDAHIKSYYAQALGVKVVVCDSKGIPISEATAPVRDYLPNTAFNI